MTSSHPSTYLLATFHPIKAYITIYLRPLMILLAYIGRHSTGGSNSRNMGQAKSIPSYNVANQLANCVLMLRPMVQRPCLTLLRAAVISFHLCHSNLILSLSLGLSSSV